MTPEEAFSVLGNEIRMNIVKILGNAQEPLTFTELQRKSDVSDPGQFNYHLEQLVGHFVQRREDRYVLRRPGERMIEAVHSGAITEAPVLERTSIDWSCHFCGAHPVEMEYREEQVGVYCTECEGMYGGSAEADTEALPEERQRLHYSHLPPAGVASRTPLEVLFTAAMWTNAELVMAARRVCPRCSARLDASIEICDRHDGTDRLCDTCNRRYASLYRTWCSNCVFEVAVVLGVTMLAEPQLRAFLIEHGLDPLTPRSPQFTETINQYEERIRSEDPLTIELVFSVDDRAIGFTLDRQGNVMDVERYDRPTTT